MANKKCPVAKKCSGCQLSNMTYEQQLEWKQKDTEKLLGGFGKVSKIIGADDPYNYRNKVQAVFRSDRNGRIISAYISRPETALSELTAVCLTISVRTR